MDQAEGFTALWESYAHRVFAYAARHTDRDTAQDVVAETFLAAWRRGLPLPQEPLPWLLVTARNTILNRRRGAARQDRLDEKLRRLEWLAEPAPAAESLVSDRADVLSALNELTDRECEALFLTAWDGLTTRQAARVAGCSPAAFHVRAHRARQRLERLLDAHCDQPGSTPTQPRVHQR